MTQNDLIIKMMKHAISDGKTEQFLLRITEIYDNHFNKYHSLKAIITDAGKELGL